MTKGNKLPTATQSQHFVYIVIYIYTWSELKQSPPSHKSLRASLLERLTCCWGGEVWVMWGLLAQRSRIRGRGYVSRRRIKRWGVGVESACQAEAQLDQLQRTLSQDLNREMKVKVIMMEMVTAPTWWRRVGVGIAGWRSSGVHPIKRGRRVRVGPVGHVGASTKPRIHWLTSWGCETQSGRRRQKMKKNFYTTTILWHSWQCWYPIPWAATCSMYWPNSIAPPAAKISLNVALPSQPPVRETTQRIYVATECWKINLKYCTFTCNLAHADIPPGSALTVPLM